MFEYTPGTRAWITSSGKGFSQRSGFHSSASGPQSARSRLRAAMPTKTFVPLGTGTLRNSRPSSPRRGVRSGRTVSWRALWKDMKRQGSGNDLWEDALTSWRLVHLVGVFEE